MLAEKTFSPTPRLRQSAGDVRDRLLTSREVVAIAALHRTTIHKKIAAGLFPKPVRPNGTRCKRWLASEIQDYIAAAVTARDATLPT